MTAEERLRAAVEWYKSAPERARQERDKAIREVAEECGLRQVDIIKFTGYSRETVRQALGSAVEEVTPAPKPRKRASGKTQPAN